MDTVSRLAFRALNGGRTPEQKRQHKNDIAYAEEKNRVLEQRPPPLPTSRLNLSQTSLSSHTQPTSPLLTKLPPELRSRIWGLVLGGHVFHLVHVSKRIAHKQLECSKSSRDKDPPVGSLSLPMAPAVKWTDEGNRIPQPGEFNSLSLSLLQTCHAIYNEALPVLYNSNTFSLASPLVLLYLKDYILRPQHFAEIRHLQLVPWVYFDNPAQFTGKIHEPFDSETWTRFWKVVGKMRLSSLGLWLEYWGQELGCTIGADWMEPVLQVHDVGRVGVHIQYRCSPWDWKRMPVMEEVIEKAWTSPGVHSD